MEQIKRSNYPENLQKQANQLWATYLPKTESDFWKTYHSLLQQAKYKAYQRANIPKAVARLQPPGNPVYNNSSIAKPAAKRRTNLWWLKVSAGVIVAVFIGIGIHIFITLMIFAPTSTVTELSSYPVSSETLVHDSVVYSLNEAQNSAYFVEVLDLQQQALTTFPNEILKFTDLKRLYLQGNQLTSLPKEISQLKNLEVLHLHSNQLTSLPKEISQLKNLKVLTLWDNVKLETNKVEITRWLPNCKVRF